MKKIIACLCLLAVTGCSGSIERWIVNARVYQGEGAMMRGNVRDAELSYALALRVDPNDERARAGYVEAAADLAKTQYEHGLFEDGLATINAAQKYDPQNVRLQALHATLEQAKLNREIVISNYPNYSLTGQQIEKSFASLDAANKEILHHLHRFNNTYDTQNLTRAIKSAYQLQLEVNRTFNRLLSYRQLVESGIPSKTGAGAANPGGSILPLP